MQLASSLHYLLCLWKWQNCQIRTPCSLYMIIKSKGGGGLVGERNDNENTCAALHVDLVLCEGRDCATYY